MYFEVNKMVTYGRGIKRKGCVTASTGNVVRGHSGKGWHGDRLRHREAARKRGRMRYEVRCDECKKPIKKTDNVVESYQGGTCQACRVKRRKSIKERMELNYPKGFPYR